MKKSTILLLVVVYIISFFVIGLLGHSIRNYNPEVYPESIEVIDPDNKTTMHKNQQEYNYWFVFNNYKNGSGLRIKASIKPDNCTYPNVSFSKEGDNAKFNLETHSTNENIEQNFALITPNETLDAENPMLIARFYISAENPGAKTELTKLIVGVCFTIYD